MAIKDLEVKQGQVDIVVNVIEKGDVREFEKFGRKGRVCSARVKDATGEMILSLWNEQIDTVNVGDKIHIINGYVSEWQGEKQLTTGRFGQLEIVEEETTDKAEENKVVSKKKTENEEENISSEDEGLDEDEFIKDEEEIK